MHVATPLGALFFSGIRWAPGFWLAFVLLVLIHEVGHAWVVRRSRARVLRIDILPIGGLCAWEGQVSRIQRASIAWGGVWAQMLLLGATQAYLAIAGPPATQAGAEVAHAFTRANLWILALNLLPVPPFDGAEAWKLVPLLRDRGMKRFREWRYTRASTKTRRTLDSLTEPEPGAKPPPEIESLVDSIVRDAKKPD